MKYRINENPRYSVVPVVELIPGQQGVIKDVGLHDDSSVIFTSDNRIIHADTGFAIGLRPPRLAEYNDIQLKVFSMANKLPLEELQEIRTLEKQYRSSATFPK